MSKRKSATKKPWHICDDVIDPVAVKLHDIVLQDDVFHYSERKPPGPYRIENIYHDHDVEFAITWLKLNISVDFATDFRKTLHDPLLRFRELCSRALKILDNDLGDVEYSPANEHLAIQMVLDKRFDLLRKHHPDREHADPLEDEIFEEILYEQFKVKDGFRDAVCYLQQVSALLRAKLAQKTMDKQMVRGSRDSTNSDAEAEPNTARYRPPPCPKCQSSAKVQSTLFHARKLRCKQCGHAWTVVRRT